MKIYFLSNNKFKIVEVKKILSVKEYEIEGCNKKNNEIHTD